MSEEEIIKRLKNIIEINKSFLDCDIQENSNIYKDIQGLLDLYQQEKEKNNELQVLYTGMLQDWCKEKEKNKKIEKQYKILEVEKLRYNIQYLESNISQTPDTAMLYHSMKKHLETLKEEKIKLEADLQELLEERN